MTPEVEPTEAEPTEDYSSKSVISRLIKEGRARLGLAGMQLNQTRIIGRFGIRTAINGNFELFDTYGERTYKTTYKTLDAAIKALNRKTKSDSSNFHMTPLTGGLVLEVDGKIVAVYDENLNIDRDANLEKPTVEPEATPEAAVEAAEIGQQ